MFCVNIMSDGQQCVFKLQCVVLTLVRAWFWSLLRDYEITKSDSLVTFFLLVLRWHQFWSQHWFPDCIPCCGHGRNTQHIALTSCEKRQSSDALLSLSSIPPSCLHTQGKHWFFGALRKRHLVFLDPAKQKLSSLISGSPRAVLLDPQKQNIMVFDVSGRTPPCNLTRKGQQPGLRKTALVCLDLGSEEHIRSADFFFHLQRGCTAFCFFHLIVHSFQCASMLSSFFQDIEKVLLVFLKLFFIAVSSSQVFLCPIPDCLTLGYLGPFPGC